MATTYYNDLQKLYVAYFNRPADFGGLSYYEGLMEASTNKAATLAGISADFAKSTEYTDTFKGMSSAEIVNAIYVNLFGHNADDAGKKYYADFLDAKKLTLADVVTEVAKGAQGSDLTAYNNKLTAAAAFTAAVDTDAEKAGYSGAAANKIAKTFLAGVTDNVSLASATTPAALNSAVANAVAAGTTFSVASALAQSTAANKAMDAYVTATVKTDVNGDTFKNAADIKATQTNAVTKVGNDLSDTAAQTLYKAATTSQAVRDALVSNQQAINAKALSDAQDTVAKDNANIAKIAGLSDAVAISAAAQTNLSAAQDSSTAAQADLAAKEASFGINNGGTATSVTVTGTAITFNDGTTTTTLATIANGKATVSTATGFDASAYTGLTDLVASYNASVTAAGNVTKAMDNAAMAQLGANLLDVAPDTAGTVTVTGNYAGTYTESALIAKIASVINTTTTGAVATGATPTLAQIQTELAVLKAGTDTAAYNGFKALVDAETGLGGTATLDAKWNPLVAKQVADTAVVTAAAKTITTLTKDLTALTTANANVETYNGLKATADVYAKVLTDKGYAVTTLDATHLTNFATASSDIYVVSTKDASIAAFGLQGTDSLFVGTGYSLVQGSATGTSAVKGSDAALEIFVSSSGGDTILQVEQHAYSSSVNGGTGEIVTITLTGVDATTIKLDSTGIITGHA
ncbi:DUF4214 domain-containing protein [Massilia aerilata]|uniref:DUF4214 domain-containing protein n=1 Tax=Massilia aerilata TaxID=453817 RepID=A0ABW0S720_9BURK